MPTLYVIEPGSRLEKEYSQLLITKEDEVLVRLPIQRVSQVVLVGNVGLTTPAMQALLEAEIPTLLVNRSGRLSGRLLPAGGKNLPLRQQQYRRNDQPDFCLDLARAVVLGKLHNQRIFALRLARRHSHLPRTNIEQMSRAIEQATQATNLDSLRGHEGHAAGAYFEFYNLCLASQWQFAKRSRRPPTDPTNALLSLGYTFLSQGLMTALESVGLDPYLGYFHTEKYGRPALALDLMEEFRTPVVDSLVLSILNHQWLQPQHFETDPTSKATRLTTDGWRIFLHKYSDKLESEIQHRGLGRSLSYRKLFEYQARQLVHLIMGNVSAYQPFRAR